MLTKEECLKYIDNLITDNYTFCLEECVKSGKCVHGIRLDACEHRCELESFKQLINEHFDNPPLKFEELKEGMWVWDVKNAEWVCIDRPIANVSYCKNLSGLVIFFEENRFYRKQVQEDD